MSESRVFHRAEFVGSGPNWPPEQVRDLVLRAVKPPDGSWNDIADLVVIVGDSLSPTDLNDCVETLRGGKKILLAATSDAIAVAAWYQLVPWLAPMGRA